MMQVFQFLIKVVRKKSIIVIGVFISKAFKCDVRIEEMCHYSYLNISIIYN